MKKIDYRAIGKRIRALRDNQDLTQEQLAEKADLSLSYISDVERGVKGGMLNVFISIASALNISLDELIADNVDCDSVIFERNLTSAYKSFGKVRREMLLSYIDFLTSKPEYDPDEEER